MEEIKNEVVQAAASEAPAQPTVRCKIVIFQNEDGQPNVHIEGDLIAAGGMMEYAKIFLDKSYNKDIDQRIEALAAKRAAAAKSEVVPTEG